MRKKPISITELVLRDGSQSLIATRLRIEDMLPIADKLDKVGFWSLETWGGATFDACIRYLGEDPWERLRQLKAAMPNTPQQMLLRGQNLLGYRHYADDVVEKFVERSVSNGIDVFRIFDAMNDIRNLETATKAVIKQGKHAQGTMSYTTSPVHTLSTWTDMAQQLQDMGCHSIAIKDMAGLLNPYDAERLVTALKAEIDIPIAIHSHATTGMSVATLVKAIDAGVDIIDTAISSMSMTYSHSATESLVAICKDQERDSGLDLDLLEEIGMYFRTVRKKYAQFEGGLQGVDSRILVAQVPGGMLTNMESQLREQGATDKFDEVLKEIPRVRKDLGYLPLVTPTSQIVGTQAVFNVLNGEPYKTITKETAGVLKGEYGRTPTEVNQQLQKRVLKDNAEAITCRPADLIDDEFDKISAELSDIVKKDTIETAEDFADDVLTYALFAQTGLNFLKNRHNSSVFEPIPTVEQIKTSAATATNAPQDASYEVIVDGRVFNVDINASGKARTKQQPTTTPSSDGQILPAPLAGQVIKIEVEIGSQVNEGDILFIFEAMKMETEVRSPISGVVEEIYVHEHDTVAVGDALLSIV